MRFVILVILVVHVGLLTYSANIHSSTIDEPAHLVTGIYILQSGRFDLYPVNPPLVRVLAALPVFFDNPGTDWSRLDTSVGARAELSLGEDFAQANSSKYQWYLFTARVACIPFSLLAAIVCFTWARQLYGQWAGVFALSFWCFSPNVLGHASLITSDVAGAATGLLAAFTFARWLQVPTWLSCSLAGIAMGAAISTKFTWLPLLVLWPLIWGIGTCRLKSFLQAKLEALQILAMIAAAIYVVNLMYVFDDSMCPLGQYEFVSASLKGDTQEYSGNRFRDTWLNSVPVPFPKQFLQGIDLQKRDFDHGKLNYLNGELRQEGWWYYYLYATVMKMTEGSLLAILVACGTLYKRIRINLSAHFVLFVVPLVVYFIVSSHTSMNVGFRYVLPAVPFFAVIAAGILENSPRIFSARGIFIAFLAISHVGASLMYFPHSLSYFNSISGGAKNGYLRLNDCNVDWGQDLLLLEEWKRSHPEAHGMTCITFGLSPQCIDGTMSRSDVARIVSLNQGNLVPGWYAVSTNFMTTLDPYSFGEQLGWTHELEPKFRFLLSTTPVDRIGYSIHVFHIRPVR